ncbi:MAG TPA: hypothetical protein VFJ85_03755 [Acidimicrobiales bacterium]|nr:hypothetical protein [Acidimicrobiales bacterium]
MAAKAIELLGPGTTLRGVFVGRAHRRVTGATTTVLVLFGAAFVVALLFGVIIYPGGLLLWYLINSIRPSRVVVVADQGVALLSRSWFTNKPDAVVATLPHAALDGLGMGGRDVVIGPDRITFTKGERARLGAATAAFVP